MRYSRLLEENSFSNRKADYIWLLALCAMFLLASVDHMPRPEPVELMGASYRCRPIFSLCRSCRLRSHSPWCTSGPDGTRSSRCPFLASSRRCTGSPNRRLVFCIADRPRITAPYLPACLVAFSWILQGGFKAALADIVRPDGHPPKTRRRRR